MINGLEQIVGRRLNAGVLEGAIMTEHQKERFNLIGAGKFF